MNIRRWRLSLTGLLLGCTASQHELETGDRPETGETDVAQGPVFHGYFAVHLEPGTPPTRAGQPNTARMTQYLTDLSQLVSEADVFGHKLTLMFTAQWAYGLSLDECILPDDGDGNPTRSPYQGETYESCLTLVRAWAAHGHEIAMHHHPYHVNSWDGFANGPPKDDPHYLGDMTAMMTFLSPLADTFRSATSEEFPEGGGDFQFTGARGYTEYVGVHDGGDLVSKPCAWTEGEQTVWRSRMRHFTSASAQPKTLAEVERVFDDYAEQEGQWTLGFVTHAKNVDETGLSGFSTLFEVLSSAGVSLKGLATVSEQYDYARTPADEAPESYHCGPDEGGNG